MTVPTDTELKAPKEWVAGFLYVGDSVALILKARPDWQAGKLNGVGGHVEPGETPEQAMAREWSEEASPYPLKWRKFCVYDWKGGRVHFFSATSWVFPDFRADTDEPVSAVKQRNVAVLNVIPNLRWLVPLGIDKDASLAQVQEPDAWNTRPTPSPVAGGEGLEREKRMAKLLHAAINAARGLGSVWRTEVKQVLKEYIERDEAALAPSHHAGEVG